MEDDKTIDVFTFMLKYNLGLGWIEHLSYFTFFAVWQYGALNYYPRMR